MKPPDRGVGVDRPSHVCLTTKISRSTADPSRTRECVLQVRRCTGGHLQLDCIASELWERNRLLRMSKKAKVAVGGPVRVPRLNPPRETIFEGTPITITPHHPSETVLYTIDAPHDYKISPFATKSEKAGRVCFSPLHLAHGVTSGMSLITTLRCNINHCSLTRLHFLHHSTLRYSSSTTDVRFFSPQESTGWLRCRSLGLTREHRIFDLCTDTSLHYSTI